MCWWKFPFDHKLAACGIQVQVQKSGFAIRKIAGGEVCVRVRLGLMGTDMIVLWIIEAWERCDGSF